MKKLILLVLSFYLYACSSETTKTEQPSAENVVAPQIGMANESTTEPMKTEKIDTKNEESISVVAPVVASSLYTSLNEAIKTQNDDAIFKTSSEVLTQNPKDIKGLNALALFYYKKGHLEAAQFLFNKAISINPSSSELYGNLGLVELAKGDRRDAIRTMRKALEINPQDGIVGANLGSLYIQDKDYVKAIFALEIPIKKGMKDYKVMNNYAIALAGTGKVKDAAEIYEKLLKENQSQREVMLNYAILLIENMQKNKEGLDLLNRLKFVGAPQDARDTIKNLENKAKAGLQ